MKILAVSDHELPNLYNASIVERFGDVDLVIGCGDMGHYYLEYILSMLNKPLYYVNGNHAPAIQYGTGGPRSHPWGGINLHRRAMRDPATGLLLAGIEGSILYNNGPQQYSQSEMWQHVYHLVPRLLFNRVRYGRYLDIFVTHAPPWKINDAEDLPHRGIKAFVWLIHTFKPAYHLHGHVHLYRQDAPRTVEVGPTQVVNTCGYQIIEMQVWQPKPFR